MGQRIVCALHQILVNLAAPIVSDVVDKFLSIPCRAPRIDHHGYIPWGSEELFVPAIAPVVGPRPLRAAMHEQEQRILLGGIKVRRLDNQALDAGASGTLEPEWL